MRINNHVASRWTIESKRMAKKAVSLGRELSEKQVRDNQRRLEVEAERAMARSLFGHGKCPEVGRVIWAVSPRGKDFPVIKTEPRPKRIGHGKKARFSKEARARSSWIKSPRKPGRHGHGSGAKKGRKKLSALQIAASERQVSSSGLVRNYRAFPEWMMPSHLNLVGRGESTGHNTMTSHAPKSSYGRKF
jgi:hypothetical protein